MISFSYTHYLPFCLYLIFSLSACQPKGDERSIVYQHLFGIEEGTFRGIFLQDDISVVKRKEENLSPLYEDPLGISYKITTEMGEELYIEYYTPLNGGDQPLTQISSIVVNVFMKDEAKAANLYTEILSHLNQTYGVSKGTFEDHVWEDIVQSKTGTGMEVILKLDESKNKLTLNYISKP